MGKITSKEKSVFLVAKNGVSLSVKDGEEVTVKATVTEKEIPIKKGEVLGTLEVYCNGEKVGSTDLIAEKTVKKTGLFEKIAKWFKLTLKKIGI